MKREFKKMIEVERQMNEADLNVDSDTEKLSIMIDKMNGIKYNKYNYSKIYKLSSSEAPGIYYYGSTTMKLNRRIGTHKSHYKSYKNGKGCYITSFELVKYSDCKIELVAKIKCNNRKELGQHEGIVIQNNKCINKRIEGRTKNESYKSHYEKNKNKIKESKKEYRDQNKNIINQKYKCVCGGNYTYANKSQHNKSSKHQQYLTSLSSNSSVENEYDSDEFITDSE